MPRFCSEAVEKCPQDFSKAVGRYCSEAVRHAIKIILKLQEMPKRLFRRCVRCQKYCFEAAGDAIKIVLNLREMSNRLIEGLPPGSLLATALTTRVLPMNHVPNLT
jgi:hypothetical protein